tara:strand:+ start:730 stop:981 length:252 start_codon:yes stop_codon:yes gene_type:complete
MYISRNELETIICVFNDDEDRALQVEAENPVEMLNVIGPLEELAWQAEQARDFECLSETLSLRNRIFDQLKLLLENNIHRYIN